MMIERAIAQTPHTSKLAREISAMRAPCVGCPGCRGLCQALIDTIILPDLILKPRPKSAP